MIEWSASIHCGIVSGTIQTEAPARDTRSNVTKAKHQNNAQECVVAKT